MPLYNIFSFNHFSLLLSRRASRLWEYYFSYITESPRGCLEYSCWQRGLLNCCTSQEPKAYSTDSKMVWRPLTFNIQNLLCYCTTFYHYKQKSKPWFELKKKGGGRKRYCENKEIAQSFYVRGIHVQINTNFISEILNSHNPKSHGLKVQKQTINLNITFSLCSHSFINSLSLSLSLFPKPWFKLANHNFKLTVQTKGKNKEKERCYQNHPIVIAWVTVARNWILFQLWSCKCANPYIQCRGEIKIIKGLQQFLKERRKEFRRKRDHGGYNKIFQMVCGMWTKC